MLLAQIDPGNLDSQKIVRKFGFKPNESFVTGDGMVDIVGGGKIERDRCLWYLPRPEKPS